MRNFADKVVQKIKTHILCLTLTLLTWTKWWAPVSASKWRMGFNLEFKGLIIFFSENFAVECGKTLQNQTRHIRQHNTAHALCMMDD